MAEGQVIYDRGFVSGLADYSISSSENQFSSSQVLAAIKSGETTLGPTEWNVDWSELVGNYIATCLIVWLVVWWWNQEDLPKLEQQIDSEQDVTPNR